MFTTRTNNARYIQHVGVNTFSRIPRKIAQFLGLQNPEEYTCHSFRRSSSTLLADSGADLTVLAIWIFITFTFHITKTKTNSVLIFLYKKKIWFQYVCLEFALPPHRGYYIVTLIGNLKSAWVKLKNLFLSNSNLND